MRRFGTAIVLLTAAAALSGCAAGNATPQMPPSAVDVATVRATTERAVCPDTGDPRRAYCQSILRTNLPSGSPSGYGPGDLQSAYNLPSTQDGSGQTVAVVDAYDDPNAEADLFMYRNEYGLPVCDTLNGCFTKVNQRGKKHPYPRGNESWATEISLDLDMVSATCPNCKILLVEADDSKWINLERSVDEAVALGATIVSNSYGCKCHGGNPSDYDHPGVMMVASGGDGGYYGYHDQEPADFPSVVAVGGTTLSRSSGSRGWSESVWLGTGSGCSSFPKPAWQTDSGCKHRTANDVAAIGNPQTGVAIYDSYDETGWLVIGGTSVGSALIASVFALAGNAAELDAAQSFYQAQNQQYLYDITSGDNGNCRHRYLCVAEEGYDGPTGWGTPNGINAF